MTILDSVCWVLLTILLALISEFVAKILVTFRLLISLRIIVLQNNVFITQLNLINTRIELLTEITESIRDILEEYNNFIFNQFNYRDVNTLAIQDDTNRQYN